MTDWLPEFHYRNINGAGIVPAPLFVGRWQPLNPSGYMSSTSDVQPKLRAPRPSAV